VRVRQTRWHAPRERPQRHVLHGHRGSRGGAHGEGKYFPFTTFRADWLPIQDWHLFYFNQVPFLVESKFREQGGLFAAKDDWNPNACVDGNLVTGQNPQSSKVCVDAFIALLA
jgi:hypothetical protein